MSDNARQSLTDKASATIKVISFFFETWDRISHPFLKPDSQKSTTEQAVDWAKGKADSAASTMQPNVSRYSPIPRFLIVNHLSESEVWQPMRQRRR
jgi:hypothetical protein